MRQKAESWRVIAVGIAVGVGLTAAAIAVQRQFSIGQNFVPTIRRAIEGNWPGRDPPSRFYAPINLCPEASGT